MTAQRETVSFVPSRPLRFAKGNIKAEGKQNSMLHAGPVIKFYFVIRPNSKIKQKEMERSRLPYTSLLTTLKQFPQSGTISTFINAGNNSVT